MVTNRDVNYDAIIHLKDQQIDKLQTEIGYLKRDIQFLLEKVEKLENKAL
jgi:cell division protein FtsB